MYCEITFSQKFPKSIGIFDYEIPTALQSKIKVGQLVNIPFRNSIKEGVVIKIKKTAIADKKIKQIQEIVDTDPILTTEQIELAEWMAGYYFVSLGTIIKTMLPHIPKKKRDFKRQNFEHDIKKTGNNPHFQSILKDKKTSLFYLSDSYDDKVSLLVAICKNTKKQVLIIFPTISDIEQFMKYLPKNIYDQSVVINNSLNKTQYYDAWKKIINNQIKIIIGTKLALFTPLIKLEILILDQVSNQNHKQADQNPRYDSRKVIDKISKIFNTKLLLIGPVPTINNYKQIIDKKTTLIGNNDSTKDVEIIDMKQEQLKRNFSIFSDKLLISLTNTLKKNNKVFLFINKRGTSSSVICKDCGKTMVCDECNQPLTYHEKKDSLYCHQCNKKFELPPFCPNCHGPNFKFIGTGTQKVELEINKVFGNKKIIRIDQDNKDTINLMDYDIIIGTEFALPRLDWDKISLVGVISADLLLYLPDYGSTERTWHLLNKLINLAKCPIYIQTYNTENLALKYLNKNYKNFYETELAERKEHGYPPYTEIIKLIYSDEDKNKCLAETKKIYQKIKSDSFEVSIITPLSPFIRNQWRMYLILKIKPSLTSQDIKEIMGKIPDNWIIDRNPENLL